MRAKAQTVIDVLLGEAVYGSRKQRLADMKAIASVIANRAQQLGVSPEDVIAAPGEFSAYGKTLPAGVEAYRDLAQQALDEVQQYGPVHNATFYATPGATKNLPSGLKQVASTAGHVYFSDPKNRAIETALGYRAPEQPSGFMQAAFSQPYDMAQTGGLFGAPAAMLDSANAGPAGRAYSDLVPPTEVQTTSRSTIPDTTYSPERPTAAIDYSPLSGGVQRNQRPDEGFMGQLGDAVSGYFGPGYSVSVASGKGVMRNPDGSVSRRGNHNHPSGFAADFDVIDPQGQQVDPARMADFGAYAASRGFTGVGVGPGYMEPGRMHLDTVHNSPTAWGAGGSSGSMDPSLRASITEAGLFGAPVFGAGLPESVPAPEDRPLPDTLMASAPEYQNVETLSTRPVPIDAPGNITNASFTQGIDTAPAAQGMFGPPANISTSIAAQPPGEIGFKGGSIGAPANDLSGIQKALETTRSAAAFGQPGGTMFSMADAVNAQQPNIGMSGTATAQPGIGVSGTGSITAQPSIAAPQQPSHLLSPDPMGVASTPDYPAAPEEPSRLDKAKARLPGAMKRAAIGAAIGGLPGAAIGLASGLLGGENGMMGGLFDGPGPIDRFQVERMADAIGGARGATARSSNGSSYTSLGPNMGGIRTSGKYGWTEHVGPDGSTRGGGSARGLLGGLRDAFNAGGGLFGDRPGGLFGGLFGGERDGGFSKSDRDKFGGRVGLW